VALAQGQGQATIELNKFISLATFITCIKFGWLCLAMARAKHTKFSKFNKFGEFNNLANEIVAWPRMKGQGKPRAN
jgi:hypothetical protein